jgi:hypothetical protein
MVDWLHIHKQNRMMKPLAIAFTEEGRGLQGWGEMVGAM